MKAERFKLTDVEYSKKTNPKNFVFIVFISCLLGVYPWYSFESLRTYKLLSKVYAVTAFIIISATTYFHIEPRVRTLDFITYFGIIDIICIMSLCFITIYAVWNVNFYNSSKLMKFLKNFEVIDKVINNYLVQINRENRAFRAQYALLDIVLPLLALMGHLYTAIWIQIPFVILETLQRYHVIFLVILMKRLINIINLKYHIIGKIILFNFKKLQNGIISTDLMSEIVQNLIICCNNLYDQVLLFNDIFGLILLAITINALTSYLMFFKNVLIFSSTFPDPRLFLTLVSWSLYQLALVLILAAEATQTYKKASSLANICYGVHNSLHISNLVKMGNELDWTLRLLSSKLTLQKPRFSAVDFFNIDYKWIFLLFNMIVMYVTVIAQYFTKEYDLIISSQLMMANFSFV